MTCTAPPFVEVCGFRTRPAPALRVTRRGAVSRSGLRLGPDAPGRLRPGSGERVGAVRRRARRGRFASSRAARSSRRRFSISAARSATAASADCSALAFPPGAAASGRFFVTFVNTDGNTVVSRFYRSPAIRSSRTRRRASICSGRPASGSSPHPETLPLRRQPGVRRRRLPLYRNG